MLPNFIRKIVCSEKWLELDIPLRVATLKLKAASGKCSSIESCIDVAFSNMTAFPFLGANIQPSQVKEEIKELLKILLKLKPVYVLEVGTAKGGSLFLFAKVSASNATLFSIDLPDGPFGGGYSQVKMSYYKSFASQNQRICLLHADSHSQCTFNIVKDLLEGHRFDFLFIDGDHHYSGVKKDFEMYCKFVRKGGIIALHDICVHSKSDCKVSEFWSEIKDKYKSIEIVKDPNQGWAGIGVVYV